MPRATATQTRRRARVIVEEGVDVRKRMHDLAAHALSGDASLGDVGAVVREAMEGVRAGIDRVLPPQRESVLREVAAGLSDASAAAADAARASLSSAQRRGRKLTRQDLRDFAERMGSLEESFLDTLSHAAGRLSEEARNQMRDIVGQMRKAGTQIRPAARRAVEAADGRYVELAGETLAAGGRAARALAGEMAMGLSGLLSGVGERLRQRRVTPAVVVVEETVESRRSPKKKASKKKTARKVTTPDSKAGAARSKKKAKRSRSS